MEGGKEEARGGWDGRREQGEGGREGGREVREGAGREGATEEAMLLCRERASVEEEGLREGGLMKGTSEEGTEWGMDGARERGKGGSEQRMD